MQLAGLKLGLGKAIVSETAQHVPITLNVGIRDGEQPKALAAGPGNLRLIVWLPRASGDIETHIVLGDVAVRNTGRALVPYASQQGIDFPALWPGKYRVTAAYAGKAGASLLAEPVAGEIAVARARPADSNEWRPIWATNLRAVVPHPSVRRLEGQWKLPVRVIDSVLLLVDLAECFKDDVLTDKKKLAHYADAAIRVAREQGPAGRYQPFAPVIAAGTNLEKAARSAHLLQQALPPLQSRDDSHESSHYAAGILAQTAELSIPDEVETENYRQSVEFARQALQLDPNNVHALVMMAVAHHNLGHAREASELLLTSIARLHMLERLVSATSGADPATAAFHHIAKWIAAMYVPADLHRRVQQLSDILQTGLDHKRLAWPNAAAAA